MAKKKRIRRSPASPRSSLTPKKRAPKRLDGIRHEFPNYLLREVTKFGADWDDKPLNRTFEAWALATYLGIDGSSAFNQTDTVRIGDGTVDGWYFCEEDQTLTLLQAKWCDSFDKTYSDADFKGLVAAACALKGPRSKLGEMKNRLLDIARDWDVAIDNGWNIVLLFATNGKITDTARNALETSAEGIDCQADFLDIFDLQRKADDEDMISDLAGETIAFDVTSETEISTLSLETETTPLAAKVATLDGHAFGTSLSRFGSRPFHANVRYNLGRKNRVNKELRETIKNPKKRKLFWLYNNGITVVCSKLEQNDAGTAIIAENPQIVNGAQTSSVIRDTTALFKKGDLAIQARFIEVPQARKDHRELIAAISEYTNNQTPVKLSDLRANEERHRKLQRAFDQLDPPWFYIRRKGEWQALEAVQKQRYGANRIEKEKVGQMWRAFSGQPAFAIVKKDDMFLDSHVEKEVFNPDRSAEEYLLACRAFAIGKAILNASQEPELRELVPGWWDDEKVKESLVGVRKAHSIAAAHIAAMFYQVLIWRYGQITPEKAAALRRELTVGETGSSSKTGKKKSKKAKAKKRGLKRVVPEAMRPMFQKVLGALYTWSNSTSAADIRTFLQRDSTFTSQLSGELKNALAQVSDKASIAADLKLS